MSTLKRFRESPGAAIMAAILFGAVIWQLSEILRGWDHVIIAHQGFRQGQTAISAYYFLKDGFSLTTTIPVFGAPWILPVEFPLYQWLLAGIVSLTGWPLDQTGRALSLFFHFLSLFLLHRLLRQLGMSPQGRLFALCLATFSPLALYWSQGVLIESLSVAITLGYVHFTLRALKEHSSSLLAAAILLGALASVVKVTTFSIGWGFLVLYGLFLLWENRSTLRTQRDPVHLVALTPYLVPLLAIGFWLRYTNNIIDNLPMGPDVMGNFDWYFGSIKDRFQSDQWMQMTRNAIFWSFGSPFPFLIAILPLCMKQAARLPVLVFGATAASGPLVFWNVFYVHDYYSYETLLFTCAALALCFEVAHQHSARIRAGLLILQIVIMGSMVYGYYQTPYAWLLRNDHKADHAEFLKEIGQSIEEDTFLVAAGYDWDPSIAYEAERRFVMLRWPGMVHSDEFKQSLEQTMASGFRPAGVLIHPERVPPEVGRKLREMLGATHNPTRSLGQVYQFYPVE